MPTSVFKDIVRGLLVNRRRTLTYEQIAKDTGLPFDFVLRYSQGKIDDPGVCRVETLYTYFTGKPFELSGGNDRQL